MHCFFGKGEQCNYIHCNRVGGEGCLSHKGWQNKRQREKTRRHFQLKQLKFLLRVLYILNPHPTIYTVSNKLLSSHTHTHPHKKSLVKYLFPTRHSHCFLQIPDYSQYFSLMHACTHTHAHALPHACTQTHMHTHAHTHTHTFCTVYPVTMLKHPHLPHPQSPPHPHLPPANKTMTML